MCNLYTQAIERLFREENRPFLVRQDYDKLSNEDLYTLTVYRSDLTPNQKEALIKGFQEKKEV